MKILYVTTIGSTMGFFRSFIGELISQGHKVDIAANENIREIPRCFQEMNCKTFCLSCTRSPLKIDNIRAIEQLRKIVEKGEYDIVHCHTPIAAACTRLACRGIRKKGTKVVYTAHGFHFYTGAPKSNWIVYYPLEKWLSKYTDVLITINSEDYNRAQRKFKAKKNIYVPGVGIDISRFDKLTDKSKIRNEFGIGDNFVLLSVGELNANKNHESVIRALSGLNKSHITYVIAGHGEKEKYLASLAEELGVRLILAGYRYDVVDFYAAADAYIHPSIREGLSIATLEAMASGLPCLVGNIRGPGDLIDNNKGGYLFDPKNVNSIKMAIEKMLCYHEAMGEYNRKKVKKYDIRKINDTMLNIYKETIQDK